MSPEGYIGEGTVKGSQNDREIGALLCEGKTIGVLLLIGRKAFLLAGMEENVVVCRK